ncbi:MAG TPA: MFS transporter [Chromatiaceae bacterium]|nr:MFS transporter [Chromatiaceae bacterium]HIB83460.1 MFS transporter [Chromatiaceae bacterium]HIO14252.1 MFS transporter [Chromatiales bacterium]
MSSLQFKLLSFSGKNRILHLSWFAFFLTFLVWFNHAPLLVAIRDSMGLSDQQIKMLLILNVALTIPARIIIGMLVDAFGPRLIYSFLLFISSFLCFFFAIADTFEMLALARFLMGFVGAGFVIGIRIVSEWFPAKEVGLAEGIYKGLGNIGSAAAAVSLPALALFVGGDDGWRYATALTGMLTLVYSVVYFFSVSDTPVGSTYFKPNKTGGLEVTSKKDFFYYLMVNIPMYGALGLLTWKVSVLGMLDDGAVYTIYAVLSATYVLQCLQIYRVNAEIFQQDVPEMHRYKFKQVTILSLAYAVTFGSELAVVSMLPLYFLDTFATSAVAAGLLAACFAGMDVVSCPSGGWLSDRFGRKKTLLVLLSGLTLGFLLMSQINSDWSIFLAVIVMMGCSFFVGSGAGGVFAVVPLIRRRLTGQIAGVVGAYGNIGAVLFLTVLSFVTAQTFFLVIAGSVALTVFAVMFLEEPEGHIAEVLPDGSVQMIEVS